MKAYLSTESTRLGLVWLLLALKFVLINKIIQLNKNNCFIKMEKNATFNYEK
jgi:hypothetical protein